MHTDVAKIKIILDFRGFDNDMKPLPFCANTSRSYATVSLLLSFVVCLFGCFFVCLCV